MGNKESQRTGKSPDISLQGTNELWGKTRQRSGSSPDAQLYLWDNSPVLWQNTGTPWPAWAQDPKAFPSPQRGRLGYTRGGFQAPPTPPGGGRCRGQADQPSSTRRNSAQRAGAALSATGGTRAGGRGLAQPPRGARGRLCPAPPRPGLPRPRARPRRGAATAPRGRARGSV